MKRFIQLNILALLSWFAALPAAATTLGYTESTPIIRSNTAIVEYTNVPSGDLSTFGAVIDLTDGIGLIDQATINFGIGFTPGDPSTATGGFFVEEDDGPNEALAGELLDVGYGDSMIELLFGSLTGDEASLFGDLALMTIRFDAVLGTNPFATLEEDVRYLAQVRITGVADVAPVPLPGGMPLLLAALAGVGLLRRRDKAKT